METWEKNYTNAKHNGLKVGAYWYSTATTIDEVMAEIKAFKKALKGKELDYPVYYDIEEQATFAEDDITRMHDNPLRTLRQIDLTSQTEKECHGVQQFNALSNTAGHLSVFPRNGAL